MYTLNLYNNKKKFNHWGGWIILTRKKKRKKERKKTVANIKVESSKNRIKPWVFKRTEREGI